MFSVLVGVTIMVSLNHHFPNVNKQVILTIDDNISHLSTKLATENAKILKYKKKEKKKSLRNQICYKINLQLTLLIRLVVMLLMFVKGIMLKFLSMNLVLNKIILEVTEINK